MENVIPVTVDKSHLITIGERLYGESIELIRELVNNAYDADATEVHISLKDEEIQVSDNGSGMDLEELKQYFNIGSPYKRIYRKSPIYQRERIGEFGIGKFSVLSAAPYFEVWTKKGDFQAKVIFDKEEWEKNSENWHLPLVTESVEQKRHDGTAVTLKKVSKKFNLQEVERRLIESVPIKAPSFSIFLNGKKITAKYIPGQRIPFLEGTDYGIVYGEIIITALTKTDIKEAGIECKVRQVTIKKEFFGMEKWTSEVARISGEVNADFLPITSDRTDFIRDTPEYQAFKEVMSRVMERVKKVIEEFSDYKENRKTRKVLSEVLEKIKKALILNPEYCPEGFIPLGESESRTGEAAVISEKKKETELEGRKAVAPKAKKHLKRPRVKLLTPTAVVKRLAFGQQGVSCCVDHFGTEGPEVLTEGTVISINRDHPLFQQAMKRRETHTLHLARLITQEISLMKDPKNPRQTYARQSKLLKDALVGK